MGAPISIEATSKGSLRTFSIVRAAVFGSSICLTPCGGALGYFVKACLEWDLLVLWWSR